MKKILLFIALVMSVLSANAQDKVTVKAGTIIPLVSTARVAAADVNEGETVNFLVSNDVKVGDVVAIKQGTLVKGTVQEASKSSLAGTKGKLVINISKLILPNGDPLYLTDSTVRIYGKNKTALSVVLACIVWPCIFIPGTKAVMPEGYETTATVTTNTDVIL